MHLAVAVKRILVALDGSEEAARALALALELCRAWPARLMLAHAAPRPDRIETGESEERASFEAAYEAHARQLLEQAQQVASEQRVPTQTLLLRGSPAEAVADAAIVHRVDLVVCGSRGRGAVSRVLLGSISNRLVHICGLPLLVVR